MVAGLFVHISKPQKNSDFIFGVFFLGEHSHSSASFFGFETQTNENFSPISSIRQNAHWRRPVAFYDPLRVTNFGDDLLENSVMVKFFSPWVASHPPYLSSYFKRRSESCL